MKKFLQNALARALCILLFGILLIVYSGEITTWIVRILGLLFIIPGVVSLIGFFHRDADGSRLMLYPLLFTGCILFGFVLIIWPDLFLTALLYIFSCLLVVAASTQLYMLWNLHRNGLHVSGLLYLVPALTLAAGIYVMLANHGDKRSIEALPVIFTGCGLVVYSLLELWTIYLVRNHRDETAKGELVEK